MKGNRAEQSERLNLLVVGKAMDTLVLVRRASGMAQWVPLEFITLTPERWAESGDEYGVQFYELYSE